MPNYGRILRGQSEDQFYEGLEQQKQSRLQEAIITEILGVYGLRAGLARRAFKQAAADTDWMFTLRWFNDEADYPVKLSAEKHNKVWTFDREMKALRGTERAFNESPALMRLLDTVESYPDYPVAHVTKYSDVRGALVLYCASYSLPDDAWRCQRSMGGQTYTWTSLKHFVGMNKDLWDPHQALGIYGERDE